MDELRICHLYPDLLNLYGDRGNICALRNRLEWRGIRAIVSEVPSGTAFSASGHDIVFIGGGQDFEQEVLLNDLSGEKTRLIKEAVESGVVFLAICGGYQLLGTHYTTHEGLQYDFTGIMDIHTIGDKKRMIGDYMFDMDNGGKPLRIAGFENHSGKTYLGEGIRPLGKIIRGFGNNGADGTEGARYRNVFCSYSHGPLLPKNPSLCDILLETALKRRYGDYSLSKLDDSIEQRASELIVKRLS
ncbi:MAG: glutamine amidotransferase [Clostridia bacterium]|nr:glutamine amidotransferase [Clostridia bacterium]